MERWNQKEHTKLCFQIVATFILKVTLGSRPGRVCVQLHAPPAKQPLRQVRMLLPGRAAGLRLSRRTVAPVQWQRPKTRPRRNRRRGSRMRYPTKNKHSENIWKTFAFIIQSAVRREMRVNRSYRHPDGDDV